jgi:hypothetical protein
MGVTDLVRMQTDTKCSFVLPLTTLRVTCHWVHFRWPHKRRQCGKSRLDVHSESLAIKGSTSATRNSTALREISPHTEHGTERFTRTTLFEQSLPQVWVNCRRGV